MTDSMDLGNDSKMTSLFFVKDIDPKINHLVSIKLSTVIYKKKTRNKQKLLLK